MSIDYFYRTPSKTWSTIAAIAKYDSEKTEKTTFIDLLLEIKSDLIKVKETQASLRKHVEPLLKEVHELISLKCHQDDTNQSIGSISVAKVADVVHNHGQMVVGTTGATTMSTKALGKRPASAVFSPTIPSPSEVVVNQGSKVYRLARPSSKADSQHQPKLRKTQTNSLTALVKFGASFCVSDPAAAEVFTANQASQRKNESLASLGLLGFVCGLLDSNEPFDSFVKNLWVSEPSGSLKADALNFLEVVKYSLTSYHLVCRAVSLQAQNHERTCFVENVIPSLLSLGKMSQFVEFRWCETQFSARNDLNISAYDYDRRSAPSSKLVDALGIVTAQNNMELIVVEASSGQLKESVTHTIEDTLKLLECGVASLRKEMGRFENASLETFRELKVYCVQIIKTRITLSELSLFDKDSWRFVETRTATIPTIWSDRLYFVQYFELLATLHEACLATQKLQKQLLREHLNLHPYEGPSVGSILENTTDGGVLLFDVN